jgi:thiamine-phosphate diphosphorylase
MYQNGICFITDRTHTTVSVYDMVSAVLEAGILFIQYREKEKTRRQIYEEAVRLRELTRSFNAVFIVNDHADIALAVDADGVHLGQEDLPLQEARRIMGNCIIGISTHNITQAVEAEAGGADYIGFGPIFHTKTKDAGSPKGVDIIRTIQQNVSIPVVAIGGILLENVSDVLQTGADAVAVATAICEGDIGRNAHSFVEIIQKGRQGSRVEGYP